MLLLATLDTKASEARYLAERIRSLGFGCDILDISISKGGGGKSRLSDSEKVQEMERASARAGDEIGNRLARGIKVVVGMGGATGTRIVADAYSQMNFATPKVIVTTMAVDPRRFTADNSIVLIPSVCDIAGLGPSMRLVLDNAAFIVAGLTTHSGAGHEFALRESVALSALGVTEKSATAVRSLLVSAGFEVTVFHANGYGGRALCRWDSSGLISGLIDLTIHEIVWLLLDENSPVPQERFRAGGTRPRVILPGGANFRTAGPVSSLEESDRRRPHYIHSPDFTHVALTPGEMARAGRFLADEICAMPGPAEVLLPMGGFSTEDISGGEIDNPEGREAFASALMGGLGNRIQCQRLDAHINDDATALAAVESFTKMASGIKLAN